MGRDLRLITVDVLNAYRMSGSSATLHGISEATLELPRTSEEAYERIDMLPAEPIPSYVDVYSWIGKRVPSGPAKGSLMEGTLSRRGLTWLRAKTLKPVLKKYFSERPATQYIRALPDDTMVILDWH